MLICVVATKKIFPGIRTSFQLIYLVNPSIPDCYRSNRQANRINYSAHNLGRNTFQRPTHVESLTNGITDTIGVHVSSLTFYQSRLRFR